MKELVRLISVTPDAEQTIIYIARVSSDQRKTDTGLLNYLIRNKHWSPFEMAHMCLEINTTRAISQQIIRHRSFAFQEFSQRYAVVQRGRGQAEHNRQSSVDNLDPITEEWWESAQRHVANVAFLAYDEALSRGIARETARFVLPLSSATKLYMAGSIRSWIHYFELRCDEHTQAEHRQIANAARYIFRSAFPVISNALWP